MRFSKWSEMKDKRKVQGDERQEIY